jgi:hypothetical protein
MGLPDLYPFVLSNGAIAKLRFVHEVIHDAGEVSPPVAAVVRSLAPAV